MANLTNSFFFIDKPSALCRSTHATTPLLHDVDTTLPAWVSPYELGGHHGIHAIFIMYVARQALTGWLRLHTKQHTDYTADY